MEHWSGGTFPLGSAFRGREFVDTSSIVQMIIQALGCKLGRLVTGTSEQTDVNDLAYALWRKCHPS